MPIVPTSDAIMRLLEVLYDAAASPELWPEFLETLRQTGNAQMAYVLAVDPEQRSDLSIQIGFDESAINAYHSYFVRRDPILTGFQTAMAQHGDWVGTGLSVVDSSVLRRSELFNDFMLANGVVHHCGATLSGLNAGMTAGICMMRPDSGGEFDPEMVRLLGMLAPHVKRAVGLHRLLETTRRDSETLRQSVETVGLAIVSVDANAKILNLTAAAHELLQARDGIEVVDGILRARRGAEDSRLMHLVAGAVSTGAGKRDGLVERCRNAIAPEAGERGMWTPAAGGAMLVSRREPKRELQIVVTPFHSSSLYLEGRPAALIFLSDPEAATLPRAAILRALHGLSPVECRLADMIAAGQNLNAAAEHMRMSIETARFHLKTIFRKTRTNRQAELVKLVLGLPGAG